MMSLARRRQLRTWWPDGPRGAKDAPRMCGLEGSTAPRVFQGLLLLVHLNILLYICV
jgi:hypothetical protein